MQQKTIAVNFEGDLLEGLIKSSRNETRYMNQQVRVLVREGLERRGLLPSSTTPPARERATAHES